MKRYKSTEEFIEHQKLWQDELVKIREILLDTDLKEGIKWGFPVYTFRGKNIAGIGSFNSYFGIWFFQGALLTDYENKLINAQEGKTKAMRQWRMSSADEINRDLIQTYIFEAIENQKAGKEIKPTKIHALIIPDLLKKELELDPILSNSFFALAPYKQRDYAEYISQAKREATRESRLQKILPLIAAGVGLNEQYK